MLLVVSFSCVIWRLLHAYPPLPRDMSAMTRALAKSAHILLYVFIIAVPLTGWLILSARKLACRNVGHLHWPQIALTQPFGLFAARENQRFLAADSLHLSYAACVW